MKKSLVLFVLVIILLLSGCQKSDNKKPKKEEKPSVTSSQEAAESDLPSDTVSTLPLPEQTTEFYFSSGAGAWGTSLTLNADGTFTGSYHDSDMGDIGDGYPNGTRYVCEFSGKFSDFIMQNDYSCKMTLTDLQVAVPEGREWIEDGIKHIASEPYGIDGGTEFILYLPNTPTVLLTEEFLSWWQGRYDSPSNETLTCYGILNVSNQLGFFTY